LDVFGVFLGVAGSVAGRATAGPAKLHFHVHLHTLELLHTSLANSSALSARIAPLSTQHITNYSVLQISRQVVQKRARTGLIYTQKAIAIFVEMVLEF